MGESPHQIRFYESNRISGRVLNEQSQDALEELRTRITNLLAEIQDHVEAQIAVMAAKELFRGPLETAPDAIVVVFDDGTIQLANKQAEVMFGYSAGELLGRGVEELIPTRFYAAHVLNRAEYREDPVRRRIGEHIATFAKRRDDSEFPMAMALSSSETTEGPLVTCIIRDLTEHLQSKQVRA